MHSDTEKVGNCKHTLFLLPHHSLPHMHLFQKAVESTLPPGFPTERFNLIDVVKIKNDRKDTSEFYPYKITYIFEEKNIPPPGYEKRPIISK